MAVKDLKEYYKKVCNDYKEAVNEIKLFEKEVQENVVSPETIENMKNIIAPLIANYQQISYLMFLLNMPNKKKKQEKYKNQHKKFLQLIEKQNTTEAKLQQNKDVLQELKKL